MIEKFEKGQLPLLLHMILGLSYIDGRGVEKNVAKGMEILKIGAEKGDPNCHFHIGREYAGDRGNVPKSSDQAKRWLFSAAERGHAPAECRLAVMMRDEGDDAEYIRLIRSSESKGYNGACYLLGTSYYKGGCGLPKSWEEAVRVLTPAAERGDALSMGLLGAIICNDVENQLAPRDNPSFTRGMHWIRRAVEKGDRDSIKFLSTVELDVSKKCFRCRSQAPPDKAFLRCSRCRAAWYCSKECQVQHWKAEEGGHKQCCIKWVDESE